MRSSPTSTAHLGDVHAPAITMRAALASGQGRHERRPGGDAADREDPASEFAAYVVNQLFTIGLSLENSRRMVGAGSAGHRIAAVTEQVDGLIRDIRSAMFGLAADFEGHDCARKEELA